MKLETDRLILRTPVPEDAEAYHKIQNSEFVLRYNAMAPENIEKIKARFQNEPDDMLVLQNKQTEEMIGAVFIEEDSIRWGIASKELSYFLGEQYARMGYMKEALCAVMDYLFQKEKLQCISARCFAPNVASRNLLESLGFTQNGYIPACVKGYGDVIFDDTLYSIVKSK